MHYNNEITINEIKKVLEKVYDEFDHKSQTNKKKFRAQNDEYLEFLDKLERSNILKVNRVEYTEYYELNVWSLILLSGINKEIELFFTKSKNLFEFIRQYYKRYTDQELSIDEIIKNTNEDLQLIQKFIKYFDFLFSSRPTEIFEKEQFSIKVNEHAIKHKSYESLLNKIEEESLQNINSLNSENTLTFASLNTFQNDKKEKVFIVHGHDDSLKIEISNFLKQLSLIPIILHEQANKGKTIIEKLEHYTNVDYAIVLYTPCDIGGKKDGDQNFRARQNVVFEHGFLMSKLGRNNISVIRKGEVELPNDISGTVYVDGQTNWQLELVKELKSAGFQIEQ